MIKTNFFIKKYKLKKIQTIHQTVKYIYFFRYTDLNMQEFIFLKKILHKFHYKSMIVNQNIKNQIFLPLKGPGSLLIIYGSANFNVFIVLKSIKKLELMYCRSKSIFYSDLKLKQILQNTNFPLNMLLIQPFLNFIYYLRKIEKAIIT